jgi:hypothetical protein
MIGITLTADQIRNAPPPVRQWIEQEVMASLGLGAERHPAPPPQAAHLIGCSIEDAAGILKAIEEDLPTVNVFFEFARRGIGFGQPPLVTYRLMDIMHHTRLASIEQVIGCLGLINQALAQIRHDAAARFCGFDNEGHCFVAPETQASIAALWQNVIARQQGSGQAAA